MTTSPDNLEPLREELYRLAENRLAGNSSAGETARLIRLVREDARAARLYVEFMRDSATLYDLSAGVTAPNPYDAVGCHPSPVSGQGAGIRGQGPVAGGQGPVVSKPVSTPAPTVPSSDLRPPASPIVGFFRSTADAIFHPIMIWVLVGMVSVGVISLGIWSRRSKEAEQIAKAPPPAVLTGLAVQPVNLGKTTDARWDEGFAPEEKEAIQHGRRLRLVAGLAELKFPANATVLVEGPADFKVVDGDTCWLQFGRLTAHVPEAARGFEVLTPTARAVDQGTEFGVSVGNPSAGDQLPPVDGSVVAEQQLTEPAELRKASNQSPTSDLRPPTSTEVHVFRGKVAVAKADSRKPKVESKSPKSEISNLKSEILTAGSAVVVTTSDVKPLPAADPFKFALDKLQGKPRAVLLSEDFKTYPEGNVQDVLGPWIIQGKTRKGQGVGIGDFNKTFTDFVDQHGLADKSLLPLPPSIAHVLRIAPSNPNGPKTFPRLAHPIDAPQLAHTCQVLVEFAVAPAQETLESSLAFAAEPGPAPGIEFWRNADPAGPRLTWQPPRWYRVRILLDVADGKLRAARVNRSAWRGNEGWIRDADYQTPVPKLDWTTPPKFVIFGYPVTTPKTPAGIFNIDNIRIEVIAEK